MKKKGCIRWLMQKREVTAGSFGGSTYVGPFGAKQGKKSNTLGCEAGRNEKRASFSLFGEIHNIFTLLFLF
jgi:hypothetical protein